MIQAVLEYFALVFEVIGYTLRLDPYGYYMVIMHPEGVAIIRGIVFLAGMSMLLGQSLILFVNRVRRGRFIFSLVINGIVFLITYAVWGISVAFIAWLMFDVNLVEEVIVVFLVGLSTAPLVFGFLILIPYMGPAIGKVLNVWQLLIMTTTVEFAFSTGFIQAAGRGWSMTPQRRGKDDRSVALWPAGVDLRFGGVGATRIAGVVGVGWRQTAAPDEDDTIAAHGDGFSARIGGVGGVDGSVGEDKISSV